MLNAGFNGTGSSDLKNSDLTRLISLSTKCVYPIRLAHARSLPINATKHGRLKFTAIFTEIALRNSCNLIRRSCHNGHIMIQHSTDFETPVRPTVEDESRSIPVTVVGQSETAAETEGS